MARTKQPARKSIGGLTPPKKRVKTQHEAAETDSSNNDGPLLYAPGNKDERSDETDNDHDVSGVVLDEDKDDTISIGHTPVLTVQHSPSRSPRGSIDDAKPSSPASTPEDGEEAAKLVKAINKAALQRRLAWEKRRGGTPLGLKFQEARFAEEMKSSLESLDEEEAASVVRLVEAKDEYIVGLKETVADCMKRNATMHRCKEQHGKTLHRCKEQLEKTLAELDSE